jgi:hypothetical protein
MFGGPRHMFTQETSKPKQVRETLARFTLYFRPYWYVLLIAALLVVVATWTQVTSPELLGQLVDCYLIPGAVNTGQAGFASFEDQRPIQLLAGSRDKPQGVTQSIIKAALPTGGFPPGKPGSSPDD